MLFTSNVTFITIKLVFFSIFSIGENDFEKMPFCEMMQMDSTSRVNGSQTHIVGFHKGCLGEIRDGQKTLPWIPKLSVKQIVLQKC